MGLNHYLTLGSAPSRLTSNRRFVEALRCPNALDDELTLTHEASFSQSLRKVLFSLTWPILLCCWP